MLLERIAKLDGEVIRLNGEHHNLMQEFYRAQREGRHDDAYGARVCAGVREEMLREVRAERARLQGKGDK